MKLEIYDVGGKNPQVIAATRILIRDDHGNPIAFAVCYAKGAVDCHMVATPADPTWAALLDTIGVKPAKIRHEIEVDPVTPG